MKQDNENVKYIYWSHIKMMRECPQRYLWSKGHPDHDLGNGIGKKKPLPPKTNENLNTTYLWVLFSQKS